MSTPERHTDDAPAGGRESATLRFAIGRLADDGRAAGWPEIDASLLDDGRGAVPAFPLDLLPQPWRDWVADKARSAGAPADYVAQALLAAVAGVCGTGVEVRITPDWSEPLVLWQALVGTSSSGKSPALARVRGLLASIEAKLRAGKGEREGGPTRILVGNPAVKAIARAVSGNPRGVLLWRDRPSPWLADLGSRGADDRAHWLEAWSAGPVTIEDRRDPPLHLDRLPVSVLGTIQPNRLSEALETADDGLAARFLYSWPDPPPYCPLRERRKSKADESARMLWRIAERTRLAVDPLVLAFDERGLDCFDEFLTRFHAETQDTEGLEAAWLGKGAGTVARLAAALELLAWSGTAASRPPGPIGRAQLEAAIALWTDYFRPHASVVFNRGGPTDLERRARRVIRWLKAGGRTEVSRENVRRDALAQSVSAAGADTVLFRLTAAGFVRPITHDVSPRGGRPAERWQVNPALAKKGEIAG
jgi:hypothetical protein